MPLVRQHAQKMNRVNIPRVLPQDFNVQGLGPAEIPRAMLLQCDFDRFLKRNRRFFHRTVGNAFPNPAAQ
jgi:hypothetical protein